MSAAVNERRLGLTLPVAAIGAWTLAFVGLCLIAPIDASMSGSWLVTYEFGFVRRGLGGELLRLASGGHPDVGATVLARSTFLIAGLCFLGLALALARRGGWHAILGLAIAAAPVAISPFALQTHPDLFGFVPLTVVLLAVRAVGRRRDLMLLAAGVLSGVLVLQHESPLLIQVPWMLLAVAASTQAESLWHRIRLVALVAVPAAVGGVVVLGWGRATHAQIAALQATSTDQETLRGMSYLGDTLSDSLGRVAELLPYLGGSVALGVLYVGVQVVLLRWCVPRWPVRGDGLTRVGAVGILIGLVVLLATAFEWTRWFQMEALSGLMVLGYAALKRTEATTWTRQQTTFRALVLVAVGYLLPPMPPLLAPLSYVFSRVTWPLH